MGPKSRWGGGVGSSGDRLCQTSPIPRSPDGDKMYTGIYASDPEARFCDALGFACACINSSGGSGQ